MKKTHRTSFGFFLLFVGWARATDEFPGKRLFFKDVGAEDRVQVMHVAIGGSVVLDCEAGGRPGPIIHWIRHEQRIQQGEEEEGRAASNRLHAEEKEEDTSEEMAENSDDEKKLQLSATKSRLFLSCIVATDAGIYTCVAETPSHRISKHFMVKVETRKVSHVRRRIENHHMNKHKLRGGADAKGHHPFVVDAEEKCKKLRHKEVPAPARIFMWTVHRMEVEGVDVQLYCRPSGSGSIKVKWLDRNERPIAERDHQYQILETGDLLIREINWSKNMGLYRCIAENEFGSDEVETFLYPTSKSKQ